MNPSIGRNVHARRFFNLAFAVGVFVAAIEIGYLCISNLPYDFGGHLVGRDFVATWVGAKAALAGHPQQYFAPGDFNAHLKELFGADYPQHIWSYPPNLLLFTWPLGLLPYIPAYILYCAFGMVLYVAVVADGERRWDHLALLALAPAAMINIWTGQNGFLSAALLIGGLTQLDRRPVVAGIMFGLLSI